MTTSTIPSQNTTPLVIQIHNPNPSSPPQPPLQPTDQTKSRTPSPIPNASLLSRICFQWAYPLLKLGSQRPLEEGDLPSLETLEESVYNREKVEHLWYTSSSTNGQRRNLGRAMFMEYLRGTWRAQLFLLLNMASRIGQAWALGLLMDQFGRFDDIDGGRVVVDTERGYFYVGILVVCGLIAFPTKQLSFYESYRKGTQIKVGLVAAIFGKTLRLSAVGGVDDHHHDGGGGKGKGKESGGSGGGGAVRAGHVTNLASNDIERFQTTSIFLPFLLWGPFVCLAILALGVHTIGYVFAVGFALLLLLVPLQLYVGRRLAFFRGKVAGITDRRVGLVSQAIHGIRVVKYNGWEANFEERILARRRKEVMYLQRASRFKALNEALFYFTTLLVSVFIFTVHVWIEGEDGVGLTPKNVFTTITLLNIVQFLVTKHMPSAVMGLSECLVSSRRIQAFLELPEQQPLPQSDELEHHDNGEKVVDDNIDSSLHKRDVISLSNVTCYWKGGSHHNNNNTTTTQPSSTTTTITQKPAISNISLTLQPQTLYCIIGKVGSGKSALLQTLAGELPTSSGQLSRSYRSSLAYAEQDPWIMDGTVRENIVMGCAFDEDWYGKVVDACGLRFDLGIAGDGGADDGGSGGGGGGSGGAGGFVNGDLTVVGDRGVQCSGGQKARIGLARALYCDSDVLLLDDPLSAVDSRVAKDLFYCAIRDLAVRERGMCVVLATHQHRFVSDASDCCCIVMDEGKVLSVGKFEDLGLVMNDGLTKDDHEEVQGGSKDISSKDIDEIIMPTSTDGPLKKYPNGTQKVTKEETTQNEKRVTGIIDIRTWIAYGNALGGPITCLFLFIIFTATQVSQLLVLVRVGDWAGSPVDEQRGYISLVWCLTGVVVFLSIGRAYISFYVLIEASKRLHSRMLQSVLTAKIEFFDTNPLGRILNRFSADIGITDETLPLTIFDFLVGLFYILGSIGTAIVVLPFILIILPPWVWYFISLRKVFVSSTRELKRLEGMGRSPIFAMISESLNGIATIRANGKIPYFVAKFEKLHDSHTRALFAFMASSRWFAFHLDLLAFVLLAMASVLAVLVQDQGWFDVDPAVIGLALTLLIQLSTANFPWVIRQSAEVTNQMVSVERIVEFGSLPPEAPRETDFDSRFEDWPRDTSIAVKNLTVRYRSNLPTCLEGVSFRIEAGQRVGVVGRTGSGKSSLVQSLFRILEAESGSIDIGGVDISVLGLKKLRTSMAIIPQLPVLFSGCTVKENLDPFDKYGESNIREALNSVQMMNTIDDLPCGLDSFVAEGGSNFSVGQRQLLCLARAILLSSRIIVLDEPTANVDTNTDQLLQKTLREKFSGATIISVAHRLDTIIDYDRVLVLGNGKVIEFGAPKDLLSIDNGYFSSMVKSTGKSTEEVLRRRAMEY